MRAGEDAEADRVDVLLQRRLDDHLRRLMQAGVDDLEPGVAQRARDDLGAAVVPVESRFGDQDAQPPAGSLRASDPCRVAVHAEHLAEDVRDLARPCTSAFTASMIGGIRFAPAARRRRARGERARCTVAALRAALAGADARRLRVLDVVADAQDLQRVPRRRPGTC